MVTHHHYATIAATTYCINNSRVVDLLNRILVCAPRSPTAPESFELIAGANPVSGPVCIIFLAIFALVLYISTSSLLQYYYYVYIVCLLFCQYIYLLMRYIIIIGIALHIIVIIIQKYGGIYIISIVVYHILIQIRI